MLEIPSQQCRDQSQTATALCCLACARQLLNVVMLTDTGQAITETILFM